MTVKILFSCVLSIMICADALGGGSLIKGNNVREAWGGAPSIQTCKGRDLGTATIGAAHDVCVGTTNGQCKAGDTENYGVMMLVAREVKASGAKFCATTVVSNRRDIISNPSTTYANPKDSEICIWLCIGGYYGEECDRGPGGEPTTCDATLIKRSDFDGLSINSAGANIEDIISMFEKEKYAKCKLDGRNTKSAYKMEHDMILAVSEWTPGGHGAFVNPFEVRASYKHDNTKSWPEIMRTGTRVLACKNGYKPNATKTDCEPMNRATCTESESDMLANMCGGWNAADYDRAEHRLELVDNCYQFRCVKSGYALGNGSRSQCSKCNTSQRGGVSPRDGSCVSCDVGKIFSSTALSSGYCVDATGYSKTDMQYGKDKTKESWSTLAEQCWAKKDPDEYKACVLGKSKESSGVSKPALSKGVVRNYLEKQ